jgi:hypothetical protein
MPTPVAIIGLGRIASLLEDDPLREKPCTHAGAITANPALRLAGGMDRDEARRQDFSRRWGCPVFDDARHMIESVRPTILHIATHPDSHYHYAALAESLGVPVVVCEKPLAANRPEARKIAAIHRRGIQGQGPTRILCNHERRYAGDYRAMREALKSGAYGALLSVKGTLYMGRNRAIRDILWHDGTHLIDAALFLADCSLIRYKKRFGASLESAAGSAFIYSALTCPSAEASLPFLLEVGAGRDHLVFELDFSLERGRLVVGNGVYQVWESVESPYAKGFRSLHLVTGGFSGPSGYFSNMVSDSLACAENPQHCPVSSAEDGLRVVEFMHKIGRWH